MAVSIERRVAGERHATLAGVRVDRLVLYAIAVALAVTLTWPFFWAVSSSLKDAGEIYIRPPKWIPDSPRFFNYVEVWYVVPFARFRFPLRGLLFGLALATLMLPREVTIIPLYLMFREVGWIDTLYPLWVPYWFATGAGAFTIFLMRQFFMTIPYEYDQAAQIDGASSWWIFWRIILPLSKPALATAMIFAFLSHWNDFWGPLIFLNSPDTFTLPLGLRWLQSTPADLGRPKEHLLLAAAIMATLPILAIYFCAQKYFVQGIVMSGIKG